MAEISFDMDKSQMKSHIGEVMEHNKKFFGKGEEYRFMVFVSPGFFRIYDDMGGSYPIVIINVTTTSRYAKHIVPYLKEGYTALVSSQQQIPSRFLNPKIKSCSRLHYGIAEAEAQHYGEGVLPILFDEHGFMAESSGSNVGFLKDDVVCLPKEDNILNGCTMKFVEGLIPKCGFSIEKGDWDVYDLLDADSVFFTGTFIGIMYCHRVIYRNKRHVLGEAGRYDDRFLNMMKIIRMFSESVGVDVLDQWRQWYEKGH